MCAGLAEENRSNAETGLLTSEQFGDQWPLTVPYVFIDCRRITVEGKTLHVITLVTPDGDRYAFNGTAKAHTSYPRFEPGVSIWADHPTVEGLKKDVSAIMDASLQICS